MKRNTYNVECHYNISTLTTLLLKVTIDDNYYLIRMSVKRSSIKIFRDIKRLI